MLALRRDENGGSAAVTVFLAMIFLEVMGFVAIHLFYADTSMMLYLAFGGVSFVVDGLFFVFFVTENHEDENIVLRGLFSWQTILIIVVVVFLVMLYLKISGAVDDVTDAIPEKPDWDMPDIPDLPFAIAHLCGIFRSIVIRFLPGIHLFGNFQTIPHAGVG